MSEEDDFYRRAREELVPMIEDSAMSLTIWSGEVDVKIAMELGLAILLDKPILFLAMKDAKVPDQIWKIADQVVVLDSPIDTVPSHEKLGAALEAMQARIKAKAEQ